MCLKSYSRILLSINPSLVFLLPFILVPPPEFFVGVVRRIGVLWGRDYSVHAGNVYPASKEQVRETMWLWFNASDDPVNRAIKIIDLENFVRGGDPSNKDKGVVLCRAMLLQRPPFEQFQRNANSGFEAFVGFFQPSNYTMQEDVYYLRHPSHVNKIAYGPNRRQLAPEVITKWRLCTRAELRDGNANRNANAFRGQPVILEVFSTGTVATTWQEVVNVVEDRDGEGRVVGRHNEVAVIKHETEFVDRVEFKLIFNGQLWAQWFIDGNAAYGAQASGGDGQVFAPFFRTGMIGGWFKPSQYVTQTLPGIDPAFALMLSQLCTTEYSVENIKQDLVANTGAMPPMSMFGPPAFPLNYGGTATTGTFVYNY